jgi:hypothetical protein
MNLLNSIIVTAQFQQQQHAQNQLMLMSQLLLPTQPQWASNNNQAQNELMLICLHYFNSTGSHKQPPCTTTPTRCLPYLQICNNTSISQMNALRTVVPTVSVQAEAHSEADSKDQLLSSTVSSDAEFAAALPTTSIQMKAKSKAEPASE